ncbi:hypothetical protein A1353_12700 [Methylomonas methanica]|uniref:Uncharacterized protein n=1 Tax=Methylomonas methanica TaxID=421 RepID=A0A177MFQ9_METMH|nr:hypothetical protein [Methylomonas methanica]OAI04607.1 hypothetical protein A1353_12700 [Methylomonas methanica]
MSIRCFSVLIIALLTSGLLAGCATTRQIAVDYPKTESMPIKPLRGQTTVSGDDYYVQLVSDFDFKGDNALKGGCADVGGHYENGDLSAALVFSVHNDPLKLKREASGFLYQATTGKCNFKLETKKASLTPWLRLDSSKDTLVEYNFLTSNSHEANLSQLISDVNAASSLFAFTGVGAGMAVMGKLAGNWVESNPQVVAKTPATGASGSGKYSSETHSLPASVVLAGDSSSFNQIRLGVYEVVEGGLSAWSSESKLLGELRVYPEIVSSLLLKTSGDLPPDAHDLSLDELWRVPIQTANGEVSLRQLIDQVDPAAKPNLQPDWQNYPDVESQCRRLKLAMKDLGFNKFDRNAVLYYFLSKSSPDWKNFNISAQRAMTDEIRPKLLEQYRAKDFSGCLASEDYAVMKSMKLAVNTEQDWEALTNSRQKKEGVINPIQSAARQFLSALQNPNKDEAARQLYPLLNTEKGGNGTVLLQNHLGNFGLEALLQVPTVADEGVLINAGQLAGVFSGLNVETYSCARPAQDQGQPLANIGIMLFVTKPGSPREKGGAVEFELVQGKIARLAFQHPSFRDFEQNLADYPDLGGCRIDADLLNKLH